MQVDLVSADSHTDSGVAVVIDVLRAFTTSAFLFAAGAKEIALVTGVDEALALRRSPAFADAQLCGEEGGVQIEGFDLGNSPSQVGQRVAPRWIQRTSAGTRAARMVGRDAAVLVSGLVCLEATVAHVQKLAPTSVALIISGRYRHFDGGDDRACAELMAARLRRQRPDPAPFVDRIRASTAAAKFLDPNKPRFPARDLELACELDRFGFAMVGHREADQLIIRPTAVTG